jgi:hypothetical protein
MTPARSCRMTCLGVGRAWLGGSALSNAAIRNVSSRSRGASSSSARASSRTVCASSLRANPERRNCLRSVLVAAGSSSCMPQTPCVADHAPPGRRSFGHFAPSRFPVVGSVHCQWGGSSGRKQPPRATSPSAAASQAAGVGRPNNTGAPDSPQDGHGGIQTVRMGSWPDRSRSFDTADTMPHPARHVEPARPIRPGHRRQTSSGSEPCPRPDGPADGRSAWVAHRSSASPASDRTPNPAQSDRHHAPRHHHDHVVYAGNRPFLPGGEELARTIHDTTSVGWDEED